MSGRSNALTALMSIAMLASELVVHSPGQAKATEVSQVLQRAQTYSCDKEHVRFVVPAGWKGLNQDGCRDKAPVSDVFQSSDHRAGIALGMIDSQYPDDVGLKESLTQVFLKNFNVDPDRFMTVSAHGMSFLVAILTDRAVDGDISNTSSRSLGEERYFVALGYWRDMDYYYNAHIVLAGNTHVAAEQQQILGEIASTAPWTHYDHGINPKRILVTMSGGDNMSSLDGPPQKDFTVTGDYVVRWTATLVPGGDASSANVDMAIYGPDNLSYENVNSPTIGPSSGQQIMLHDCHNGCSIAVISSDINWHVQVLQ